jgi:hypothetical protein
MKIKYSQEFINELTELYPDGEQMHFLANEGREALVYHLNDNIPKISPEWLLNTTTFEEVHRFATLIMRKKGLYLKCVEEINDEYIKHLK